MSQKLKVGDLFQVQMDQSSVRYFQYIADDLTQLNSQVVRVFREAYVANEHIDVDRITAGAIDFHAHVFLTIGLKQQQWRKVGHTNDVGNRDVLFRDSNDYENPQVKVSDWHVWKANGPFEKIGILRPEYQQAEIGVVVPPRSLIHRMQTGRYNFVYPDY
jgi:hypothetical protein